MIEVKGSRPKKGLPDSRRVRTLTSPFHGEVR